MSIARANAFLYTAKFLNPVAIFLHLYFYLFFVNCRLMTSIHSPQSSVSNFLLAVHYHFVLA